MQDDIQIQVNPKIPPRMARFLETSIPEFYDFSQINPDQPMVMTKNQENYQGLLQRMTTLVSTRKLTVD